MMPVDTSRRTKNVRQQHITIIHTLLFHPPSSRWMTGKKDEHPSGSVHHQTDPEAGQAGELWTASVRQYVSEHSKPQAGLHLIPTNL